MERYLSCGETMAAWKSIECIIGALTSCGAGTGSSLRLVMTNLIRSPTRARTVGPGTWSPKVQALNFTPGMISMILCVVSRRTVLTGEGSSGFSSAPMLSDAPSAKAPLWRSAVTFAAGDFSSISPYGSAGGEFRPQDVRVSARRAAMPASVVRFIGRPRSTVRRHGRAGCDARLQDAGPPGAALDSPPGAPARTPRARDGSSPPLHAAPAGDGTSR